MLKLIMPMILVAGFLLAPLAVEAGFEKSLVMYLPFDDKAGEVAKDASKNSNDGAVTGAQWVDGKFGGALEFKPKSYVEPALDEKWWNENINNLSVFMWVKPVMSGIVFAKDIFSIE